MSNAQFSLMVGVEIANGQVEVLKHGEADDTHPFGDPVAAATRWLNEGAPWLHIADLDAAAGRGDNGAQVAATVAAAKGRAHIQLAGGIRDDASLAAALATGARRVVIDTAALADLDWVAKVAANSDDRVAVGVTAHEKGLYAPDSPAHGLDVGGVLDQLRAAGCRSYVVTDVDANGLRHRSERRVLERVLQHTHAHVVSCGGISRLQDLHALTEVVPRGLSAVVVDRALYTGDFTLAEAIATLEPRYDLYYWGPPS